MQIIYYNVVRRTLCDAAGDAVSSRPEISFAEKPVWKIVPVDDSGSVVIPSDVKAYRAAVAFDYLSSTPAEVRTTGTQITADESGIHVPLNANTAAFLNAVDGQEKKHAYFELAGLDSSGARVWYISFPVEGRMILDPDTDGELPSEAETKYLEKTAAAVLFAGKTDTAVTSALDARVSSAESDITALGGSMSVLSETKLDSAGVMQVISSGGYATSATVAEWLNSKADASTVNALDTRMTAAESDITALGGSMSVLSETKLDSAGVMQVISSGGYATSAVVSGMIDSRAVTGEQVLNWIAPDPDQAADIPAWNTVYQAADACWISVSFLGNTTGGAMIGPNTDALNGTPFGIWVGANGTSGEYMTVFCPKGWYYQAYLEHADASLSYSHKKVYKCKGA